MEWHDSIEHMLSELADESQIRSKLHMRQHLSYRRRNQCYTLPVVVLSVLSGSGNFISEGYSEYTKKYMIMGIGMVSILVSIVSAINQLLKLAELSEGNRIASLQWGKFFSRLKWQLSLQRCDRDAAHDFMLSVYSEYDRLYETSPILLDKFLKTVKKKLKRREVHGFVLPFYMNGFQHVVSYDEPFEDNTEDDEKRELA
jgi:hypothetical protein